MLASIQRYLLYPASRDIYRDPSYYGWPFEDLMLATAGGESTHAWWVPLEGARGVALFSHGNAGNIADRLESIGLLRSFGLSVLAYDYGGYGRSSGSPSEKRLYDDIRAAWRYLVDVRGVRPEEVILFGRSLGGGPTAQLATEVDPAGVVLESTFTSVPDAAADVFPLLPARWLVWDKFATVDKVKKISAPLLVIHSQDDRTIRYAHGQAIYRAANEPKTFLEIRGDHNIGFVESEVEYRRGWEEFLGRIFFAPGADPLLPKPIVENAANE